MKKIFCFVTLMLCVAMLACGCGSKQDDTPLNTTPSSPNTLSTEPVETTQETIPEPVYEKQTVYLCTEEKQTLHENDAVSVRYNSYDEYGRKIESWVQKPDGSKGIATTFIYDESGNNILETSTYGHYERTYDDAGRMLSQLYYSGDECTSEYYYTYNEDGYLTERKEISRYSQEKVYLYQINYGADYSSAVIDSFCDGEKTGYTEEAYNEAGQVTHYINYDAQGEWTSSCESTYDSQGRLQQEYKKFRRDTQPNYKIIYTYDENGMLLSKNADYYYGQIVEYTYEAFEILVKVN